MTVKEESEKAVSNGYKYIPPYKLNKITELSSKIVKLLTDNITTVTLCYEDMKLVLSIAEDIIDKGVVK